MSTPQTASSPQPCAGDLSPREAWQRLERDPRAILVDVRTRIELALIGAPDLSALSREPLLVEWVTQQGKNPNFLTDLRAALEKRGAEPDTPLLFLCRSGGRSRMAAGECAGLGFRACYNIASGFEGDLDEEHHRNSINGWKSDGLPWKQT